MKRAWMWSLCGLVNLVLFILVLACICPAETGTDKVICTVALLVWAPVGVWLFSKQEAAEAQEKTITAS